MKPPNFTSKKPELEGYRDNGDGTVTDRRTGLTWKRCSEGQSWNGKTCTGTPIRMSWYKAMPEGKQKPWPPFAGHGDWRLPTTGELKTLVRNDRAIEETAFPNTPPISYYWSASPYALNTSYAWRVVFYLGDSYYGPKNYDEYVRLVRGGQ